MNTYIYPWHNDCESTIEKISARNYEDCEEKIISKYCKQYDDLDDTLDFSDFCDQLYNYHGIIIGDIFDINEFM